MQENSRAFLIVARGDGSPTIYPMVGLYRDGGVECSTYRKSAKVTRVLRSPQISALITAAEGSDDRRVLLVRGRAVVNDPSTMAAVVGGVNPSAKKVPDAVVKRAAAAMANQKRCVIRLEPESAVFLGAARFLDAASPDPEA
ncbi:MAG: hypothetical protein JWL73_485 [Actinomycetia bacterium]|nr:hypothetical protein [Actinomycetes bacterium]